MNDKQNFTLSKYLSLILRHSPERAGIQIDSQGWTPVDQLIASINTNKMPFDLEMLEHIVDTNDKKRFEFSSDGELIRASQGHSLKVDLGYSPSIPPDFLYHGTTAKLVPAIRESGLHKRLRHHVHLSVSEQVATKVGSRRGAPTILIVNSRAMHTNGHSFFISTNGVWLTDSVPVEYIVFPNS